MLQHPSRTSEFFAGIRGQLPLLLGVAPFGMAFGAYAIETGLSGGMAQARASMIFGGARQVVAVQTNAGGVRGRGGLPGPAGRELPEGGAVEEYHPYDGALAAEVTANVATVPVAQDPQLIRRGGSLWAKVGPYIFVFSDETHRLFQDYPGLAGVRVVTTVGGARVASALLVRETLSDVLWRRSLNIAGRARRDGTERVTLLQDLVRWGEDRTDFEYNTRYTRGR